MMQLHSTTELVLEHSLSVSNPIFTTLPWKCNEGTWASENISLKMGNYLRKRPSTKQHYFYC